jgi:hypothetical protein
MIRIPTKISLRKMSTLVLASALCFAATLPTEGQTATNSTPSVSQQLEKLAAALRATQQQVEPSQ